jgi:hypothetical protein
MLTPSAARARLNAGPPERFREMTFAECRLMSINRALPAMCSRRVGLGMWAGLFFAASLGCHAAETESARPREILVREDFTAPSDRWRGLSIAHGKGTLTAPSDRKYDGNLATLDRALPMPPPGKWLNVRLRMEGLSDASVGELDGSARIFLVPAATDPVFDPYTMPDVLWLSVVYEKGAPRTLTLYGKAGETRRGRMLFKTALDASDLPLDLTLRINPRHYRLEVADGASASDGARSGAHGLNPDLWSGPLTLGMRAVNHRAGVRTRLSISALEIFLTGAASERGADAKQPPAGNPRPDDADAAPPIRVEVRPGLTVGVEDRTRVPRVFGITANGWTRGDAAEAVRALNLNSGRAFLWPFGDPRWRREHEDFAPPPVTPGAVQQYGHSGGVSAEDVPAQFARFFDQDLEALMQSWWERAAGSGQALQTDLFARWGITNGLVYHPGGALDDGSMLAFPAGLNAFFDAYIGVIRRNNPRLAMDFVQLSNEPNYAHFTWAFRSQREAAEAWIEIFNRVDAHLRGTHPGTRLLGPCLASGTFFSWGGWQDWTVPVLEGVAIPLKHFNYHCYDKGAYTHLVWQEMLQARADALGRPRPRAVVTEMNYGLDKGAPEENRRRVRWWAQQLFTALENPDKAASYHYFLAAFRNFTASNLFQQEDGEWKPNDTYWLYRTLADLRGRLVYVEPVADPRVRVAAASPAPDRIVAAVFNDADSPREVVLQPAGPLASEMKKTAARIRFARYGAADGPIVHGEETAVPEDGALRAVLAPGEVRTVHWTLARPIEPAATLRRHTFYSPVTGQAFDESLRVPIAVPRLPSDRETVWLRLGIYGDDLLRARGLHLALNGREEAVYWNEAPPQVDKGQRTDWWIELPLDRDAIRRENELRLSHADAPYRLMFAALVYREHPTAASARAAHGDAVKRRNGRVQAAAQPVGALMSGDRRPGGIAMRNAGAARRTYEISLRLPSALRLEDPPDSWTVDVPPGESRDVAFTLEALPVERQASTSLTFEVTADDMLPRTGDLPVTVYPRRVIPFAAEPPAPDGRLDEWPDDALVSARVGPADTRVWLAWNADRLFLAADVRTGTPPLPPVSVENFWGRDGMELFLDLGNQKSEQYDEDDVQVFLCPLGVDGSAAFGGVVIRRRRGDTVDVVDIVSEPSVQVAAEAHDEGYRLEAAVPWFVAAPDARMEPGRRIGLNLALTHWSESTRERFSASLLGLDKKYHANPDRWPAAILESTPGDEDSVYPPPSGKR